MDTTPAFNVAVRSATSRAAALDAEKPVNDVLMFTVAAGTAGIGSFKNACVELLNTSVGVMANTSCANLRSFFIGNPKDMRDEEMVALGHFIEMARALNRQVIAERVESEAHGSALLSPEICRLHGKKVSVEAMWCPAG